MDNLLKALFPNSDDYKTLWCFNGTTTIQTVSRAIKDNAFIRPLCTTLEVEWI
jgi:hypothetical protein